MRNRSYDNTIYFQYVSMVNDTISGMVMVMVNV